MDFGLIIAREEDKIYILAEGDYTRLQELFPLYKEGSEKMEVLLIPYDKDEYDNIKGRTELLIEEFKGYFASAITES